MEKLKRRLALVGAFIVILSYGLSHPKYHSHYEILDQKGDAFAKCSCGTVYIGDEEFLEKFCNEENAILVEDERKGEDPNMKIRASCNICSAEDRNEILEILMEYEKRYPSKWDRTIESMRLEWLMHNLSFLFNYQQHRTEDVDLDNEDEELYDDKLLQKVFHTQ
jgi:hypothetical protein